MKDRTEEIHVLLTRDEMDLIQRKMAEVGIRNRSAYVRKMAIDGYVVKLNLENIHELLSLLRRSSNNLNQLAKKANSTGSIYAAEIAELQNLQDEIWEATKEILARLASIQ